MRSSSGGCGPVVALQPARVLVDVVHAERPSQAEVRLGQPARPERARVDAPVGIVIDLLAHLLRQQQRGVLHDDAATAHGGGVEPGERARVAAALVEHGRRAVRGIRVARTPLEEAVVVAGRGVQEPAVDDAPGRAPQGHRRKGDGGDLRLAAQQVEHGLHVARQVELVDVDLPQVVAGGPRGVSAALLVLLAGPEAVGVAFVFGGDDHQLAVGVFVGGEAPQTVEGGVARVAVGRGDAGGARRGALDDHDLSGVRVERAQVERQERQAVQHDHAERDGGARGAGLGGQSIVGLGGQSSAGLGGAGACLGGSWGAHCSASARRAWSRRRSSISSGRRVR